MPALHTRSFAATRRVVDALGRTVDLPARIDRVVVNFNFEEFTAVAGTDGGQCAFNPATNAAWRSSSSGSATW